MGREVRHADSVGSRAVALEPPTFVVTGATCAVGAMIAARLVAAKRKVHALGRNELALTELEERLGPLLAPELVDLTDDSALDSFIERMRAAYPAIGGLVHCAGAIVNGELAAVDTAAVDHMFAVNFRAPYRLTTGLVEPLAKGRGTIVFVNSTAALSAAKGRAAYSASKSALRAFADGARVELNDKGIRVASVFPGRMASEGTRTLFAREGREYAPAVLLQPDDVANVVLDMIEAPARVEIVDVIMRPSLKSY